MTISLPDVNVWLALSAAGHVHHTPAREWFEAQPNASVGFCRVTQMGLLRLLTNARAMGRGQRTILQALGVYEELRRDRRVVFLGDSESVESVWRQHMVQAGVGASAWTDAYLAAFAQLHSASMVTFDVGFGRWTGLTLSLLSARA